MSTPRPATLLDPSAAEHRADPYPLYHRLRSESPVVWVEPGGFWFLSRYQDVEAAFRDPRLSSEASPPEPRERPAVDSLIFVEPAASPLESSSLRPLAAMLEEWLLLKDPPDHTRLRRVVGEAFGRVAAPPSAAPRITAIALALLGRLRDRQAVDLVGEYAFPLPVLVMADLLGVPEADREAFLGWSRDLWGALDLHTTEEGYRRGNRWVVQLEEYLGALVAQRRARPRGDLLSAMLATGDGGGGLSDREALAQAVLLVFASHDTTVSLIGTSLLALSSHPDEMARLRRGEPLTDGALRELLRYESPQQLGFRYALEDLEIAGVTIRRGDRVCLGIGAANRDPAVFEAPDRLDLSRPRCPHLAFAAGPHYCLGARLALQEARIALQELFAAFPDLQVLGHRWQDTSIIRGLETLHVNLRPAARESASSAARRAGRAPARSVTGAVNP